MNPKNTATHNISEPNPTGPTTQKLSESNVDPARNQAQLNVVLDSDSNAKESAPTGAENRGLNEGFRHMIKTISSLAIDALDPGVIVNSRILCAEIRYGLHHDAPVDRTGVPGLSKPERLDAGRAIWSLADAGELPLEPLGRNGANLQQYRVR
jgi:hypothetical protein